MENLAQIISLASAGLGLLATTITFLIKFIKAFKDKKSSEAYNLLQTFVKEAVQKVEEIKTSTNGNLPSDYKKQSAMDKVEALCARAKIPFDETQVDVMIEDIVALTKVVNAKK